MTAVIVYGVKVGDRFADEDECVFTILNFITPPTLYIEWKAQIKSDQMEDPFVVEVKELLKMRKIKQ